MTEGLDIWARLRVCKDNLGLVTRMDSAIYCNIWRERNGRIFENTSHTVDIYVFRVYTDIMFWIDLLSYKERICISKDDDTYL